MSRLPRGVGLGWRPETAWTCQRRGDLAFTEVVAESVPLEGPLPRALEQLLERGMPVVPHGVSLSLGSGERPDRDRLARLARVCSRVGAALVSEHVAFVRGAGIETEHLLPVPRTEEALAIVADNVRRAQDALGVPLALENIAHLFEWPDPELTEAELLAELLERTGAHLLLDAANLYANAVNFGWDVEAFLDTLPLERIAYVHVAGGVWKERFYVDTHAHPLAEGALDVLRRIISRVGPVPVLLERDDGFEDRASLDAELDAIASAIAPIAEAARAHG